MKQKFLFFTYLLSLATLFNVVLGIVNQMLIAYYLGVSVATDAYFMAQGIIDSVNKLMLVTQLSTIFLPIYGKLLETSEKEAQSYFGTLFAFSFLFAAFIAGACLYHVDTLVHFFAPGFSEGQHIATTKILILLLFPFLLTNLALMLTALLQVKQHFGWIALNQLLAPFIAVVVLVGFAEETGVYALVISTWLGAIAQVSLLLFVLRKDKIHFPLLHGEKPDPRVKETLYLMLPFVISALFVQAHQVVQKMMLSGLPDGSMSVYSYTFRLFGIINALLFTSLSYVLYSFTSRLSEKREQLGKIMASMTHAVLYVSVFLTLFVVFNADFISHFLFGHGRFGEKAVEMVATGVMLLSLAFVPNALYMIYTKGLYSVKKTGSVVVTTVISQCVHITLYLLFVPYYGLNGLLLSGGLAVYITCTVCVFLFSREVKGSAFSSTLNRNIAKILSLYFLCGIMLYTFSQVITERNFFFLFSVTLFPLFYVWGSRVLGIHELSLIEDVARKALKKIKVKFAR